MKYTSAVIALCAFEGASAFAPTVSFAVREQSLQAGCRCVGCGSSTAIRMSDEVPPEVEAMDGIESEEEKHNVERPARASGTAKHSKKEGKKPISELEVGASISAKVKTTTSYGAFLDIDCETDALLHISRMADDFVANVEDVVKAGDEVTVRVVSVDTEKGQVAVTMQSEEKEAANAAATAAKRNKRKDRPQRSGADLEAQRATLTKLSEGGFDDAKFIEGEVVSAVDFGAFVRFDTSQLGSEGEVDGLVHISSLTEGRANSVSEFVSVGDKVKVRVRSVDVDGGRVSLSMISKEAEEKSAPQKKEGGGPKRNGRTMFAPGEMGAADWAESMESLEQPSFSNRPLVIDRRSK